MASQFTIYKSTDTSAPTLAGTVGSLVALLDACLVSGYGSKAAAGWTKPFTGTNKAAFKQGTGSNGFYLRVQDDGPGAGGAREARITGYETMSDVDTGTGSFPTAVQGLGGVVAAMCCRKSNSADATARSWIVVADARTVYLFVSAGIANNYFPTFFGEFYSFLNSDSYRVGIASGTSENSASVSSHCALGTLDGGITSQVTGIFLSRGHTGLGGSVNIGTHGDYAKSLTGSFAGIVPFTNPADGGLYLSPVWIHDPNTAPIYGLRGRLRGIWQPLHAVGSFTDGDTVSGVGELSGKSFLFIKFVPNTTADSNGVMAIETSNTVETN